MHKIDFVVPLSGSSLFDIHTIATAKGLCDKFPPLNYEFTTEKTGVRISGELNDYWFEQWNKALLQVGNIEA